MLGDDVQRALEIMGVTPEQVKEWFGRDCDCEERKQKLNMLDLWARRVIGGRIHNALSYLQRILHG